MREYIDSKLQGLQMVVRLCVVLSALLVLGGCATADDTDLLQFINEVKSRTPKRIPPLPEFKTYETYTYSVQDMRDPFEVVSNDVELVDNTIQVQQSDDSGPKPNLHRNKEPLERFPLDSLRFVGQLEIKDTTWGIVTAPDGLVHRVTTGNYIGQNHGKIVSIREQKLDVVELIPSGSGGWIERNASLSIREN